jgi:hypothetical protein
VHQKEFAHQFLMFILGLNEAIKLEAHRDQLVDLAELAQLIPPKKPRYSLFRFRNPQLQDGQAVCESFER